MPSAHLWQAPWSFDCAVLQLQQSFDYAVLQNLMRLPHPSIETVLQKNDVSRPPLLQRKVPINVCMYIDVVFLNRQ